MFQDSSIARSCVVHYIAHLAGRDICMIYHMFPGLDVYYNVYPAQPLTAAGQELDDLDHDLSDLSQVCTFRSLSSVGPNTKQNRLKAGGLLL